MSKENKIWNQYMNKKRELSELENLIQDDNMNTTYQQRAMEIMLSSDIKNLPYTVNLKFDLGTSQNTLFFWKEWLSELNENQAIYAADLIMGGMKNLNIAKKKKGKKFPWHRAGEYLDHYNNMIPALLDKLPENKAEEFFSYFIINHGTSDYFPLEKLVHSDVNEKWKRKAVNELHTIIESEDGITELGLERDTYNRYKHILGFLMSCEGERVSKEFLLNEIDYMSKLDIDAPAVLDYDFKRVLDFVEDKEIKHRLVRKQLLSKKSYGFVHSEKYAELANDLIEEFSYDEEIVTRIQEDVKTYEEREEQYKRNREERENKEKSMLDKMRV